MSKKLIDLTGKRFGFLEVISQSEITNKYGCHLWLCKCDCGNFRNVRSYDLRSNRQISCGCFKKSIGENSKFWCGFGEITGKVWNKITYCAKARNLLFNITKEYIWDLFLKQSRKCIFTGIEITFPKTSREFNSYEHTASLDRIDSTKGYIEGNVQWVHKKINVMKQDMSDKEFIYWCCLVADKYRNEVNNV